jgi:hypothetical protein
MIDCQLTNDRIADIDTPLKNNSFESVKGAGIARSRSMRVRASQSVPSKFEFNAPSKYIVPLLCIYHVLVIGIIFAAYIWLDLESSS